jgi:phage-related protein
MSRRLRNFPFRPSRRDHPAESLRSGILGDLTESTRIGTLRAKLRVLFYRSSSDREPVRDWLRSLSRKSRKTIGDDIKTVQYGWPLGMPLVRSLGDGLWEVRSRLRDGVARIIFLAEGGLMILLHGFIKKSRRTPRKELAVAKRRAAELKGDGQ